MKNLIKINYLRAKKGITVIALILTIIVLLILVGITISVLTGNNGLLTRSKEAKISTEFAKYEEELNLFKSEKKIENTNFYEESLTAGKNSLTYNTQTEENKRIEKNIKDIIPDLSNEYINNFKIIKGKLLLSTQNTHVIKIAQNLEIEVNPYIVENGELKSSNNNLALVDSTGTLTIPDYATSIGEGAFANVSGIKAIIIPGTCKFIGTGAFCDNSTIEKVIIQNGCEEIGGKAFKNCSNLKEVEISESVTEIGSEAFMGDVNLEKINIPSKIKVIKSYCFAGDRKLTNINLPNGLKQIGGVALSETNISSIEIPESVTEISSTAFRNCAQLISIKLNNNKNFTFTDGSLITSSGDSIIFITNNKLNGLDTFKIPEGAKRFEYPLQDYKNIKKIIIPKSLEDIVLGQESYIPSSVENVEVEQGNTTYEVDNGQLYTKNGKLVLCFSREQNIKIKEGIKCIGSSAFSSSINATQIELPESLTELGYMAFTNGPQLERLYIGANVKTISPMFKYYNSYGNVTISDKNSNYMVKDNVLYSKDGKTLISVLFKIKGGYKVDDNVETIGSLAFHAQDGMTKIVLPNNLKSIENSLNFCSQLKEIEIPSSVEKISNTCFGSCSNLSKIKVNGKENSISGAPWGATKGMRVVEWNSK